MRALKLLLAGLIGIVAVTAGLFMAAIVALGAILALVVKRFVRPAPARTPPSPGHRAHAPRAPVGGAIDVVATEIQTDVANEAHPRELTDR